MSQQEFKIRALPRKNEKSPPQQQTEPPADKPESSAPTTVPRWIIYVGTASAVALVAAFAIRYSPTAFQPNPKPVVRAAATQGDRTTDLASTQDPVNAKVTRHMQDAKVKEEMMRRRQALDNMRLAQTKDSAVIFEEDPERAGYGVQMDQEDTADKLYKDLNYRRPSQNTEFLPDERISARVATRKWVNEHERAERINFVRNFIRSAYDRGFQVEIDKNLVVVGVKRITEPKKVNIDQVIDQMAKQGF